MSLAHFLAEYATQPLFGPYYDNCTGDRTPPFDWFEDDALYTLQLEIPGVRREDMTMHISDDGRSLTVEGKTEKHGGAGSYGIDDGKGKERVSRIKKVRKTMADGSTVIISRLEKKHNVGTTVKFSRTVTLPNHVDGKRISAKLDNGVLTVSIPKLSTHKPRRIVID